MGLLTDIFVSTPEDALRYEALLEDELPPGRYDRVEFKGLTSLEFGTLWALAEGQEFDLDKHELEALSPEGETWLYRFPAAFVQKLAALTPSDIPTLATAWAATEELQWDPSETEEVLIEMVRLSKLANSPSKGLFFWGSL